MLAYLTESELKQLLNLIKQNTKLKTNNYENY